MRNTEDEKSLTFSAKEMRTALNLYNTYKDLFEKVKAQPSPEPMFNRGDLYQLRDWYYAIFRTPSLSLNVYDYMLNAKIEALYAAMSAQDSGKDE